MLIERDAETAAFVRALERAAGGHGSVLAVTAPYGGGRTALLEQLAGRAQEAGALSVARAGAIVGERAEPGALAAAVLDELAPDRDPDPAADTDPDAEDLGLRLQTALDVIAGGPAPTGVVVVLVDDVQWADPLSARALDRFLDVVARCAAVVVLACADLDPAPLGTSEERAVGEALSGLLGRADEVLAPEPLSPAAVERLARGDRPDDEPSPRLAAALRTAGGNPMLVRSALVAHGSADPARTPTVLGRDGADDAVRVWLADRYRGPVESLPVVLLEVLAAVVVLGGAREAGAVAPLAGLDAATTSVVLSALARLGLVRDPDGHPRTAHPAVGDAVEEVRGRDVLARAHRAAAELAYVDGAPDRVVADLLIAGGDHEGHWPLEVARRAAHGVRADEGVRAAARYLRAALMTVPPGDGERLGLLVDLVGAEREFDPGAALLHALQALELADTARERALVLSRLSPAALLAAPTLLAPTLRATAEELEAELSRRADAALRMRAREGYLGFDQPARLQATAERLADDREALMGSAAGREQLTVALHASVLSLRIQAEEAAAIAGRILEHEPAVPDHVHSALPLLSGTLVAADRLDEITGWLDAAQALAEAADRPVALRVISAEQAVAAVARGDLAAARGHVETVLRLLGDEGDGGPVLAVAVFPVAAALGDDEITQAVLDRFSDLDWSPYPAAGAAYASGARAGRHGDHRRAADHYRTAGVLVEQCGWVNPVVLPWRVGLAGALAATGEREAALHILAEEHVRVQEWGAPRALGQVLRVRGTLLGGAAGRAMLDDSVAILSASADRRESARARVALGTVLHADGDAGAAVRLREGLEMARACGDGTTAAAAGVLLGGVDEPPPDAARGAGLTPTETLIAEHVAAGLSNPAIAKALGVGLRAVEKHLTRCYRKTGARGRSELAAFVAAAPRGE